MVFAIDFLVLSVVFVEWVLCCVCGHDMRSLLVSRGERTCKICLGLRLGFASWSILELDQRLQDQLVVFFYKKK